MLSTYRVHDAPCTFLPPSRRIYPFVLFSPVNFGGGTTGIGTGENRIPGVVRRLVVSLKNIYRIERNIAFYFIFNIYIYILFTVSLSQC